MQFVNWAAEQNESRTLPAFNLSCVCVCMCVLVCAVAERISEISNLSSPHQSPCTLCALVLLEQTVLRWEKQQEFHLSLIKPINGGVWCLLHSFHTHRRAAALTKAIHTHPDSRHTAPLLPGPPYSNRHTMEYHQDPHQKCVCVFMLGVSGFSHTKPCKPENTDH